MAAKYNYTPTRGLRDYGPLGFLPSIRKLHNMADDTEDDVPEKVRTELKNVIGLAESRNEYVDIHCSDESDALREISRYTESDCPKEKSYGDPMSMLTGKLEGEFLKFLVSMQQAKRVLDIGMFTGYSALTMAEALPPDGLVVTIDNQKFFEEVNRKKFDMSPHGKKIDIKIGKAQDILLSLAEERQKFDFIFLDADKSSNVAYYDIILDKGLLAPRGTLAFDNALYYGYAYLTDGDPSDALNRKVQADPRVRRVMLPIRDGVLLVRRVEDVMG